jgi:hypothetical protein
MSFYAASDVTSDFKRHANGSVSRGHSVSIRSIIVVSCANVNYRKLRDVYMADLDSFACWCPRGTFECCECSQLEEMTFQEPYGDERGEELGGFLCKACASTIPESQLTSPMVILMDSIDSNLVPPQASYQNYHSVRSLKSKIASLHLENNTSLSDGLKYEMRDIAASQIQAVVRGWLIRQRAKREMKAYQRGVQLMLVALKQQSLFYDSECLFRAISMGRPPYLYPRFPIRSPTAPAPSPAVPAVSDAPDAPVASEAV